MAVSSSALALTVFFVTYAVIVSEKIHRTVAAFAGAVLVLLSGVVAVEEAVNYIDFNTIGLLVGMMLVVGIARPTGIFEYAAIKASRLARGEPLLVMVYLAFLTAVLSALLDNVTTVLLMVPVTLSITRMMGVSPTPYLITEILACNIGGAATLIGDPPNIMIGGATHLGFMDFATNLTPVVVVVYTLTMFILLRIYSAELRTSPERQRKIMEMDENNEIKDHVLAGKSLLVLVLTILGFTVHQLVHLESSVIALGGATILMAISRVDPERALHAVEWTVIFFFLGLFVVVGALEETGVMEAAARLALEKTHGALFETGLFILWLSALASSFVDNIPFVAAMIPLIKEMGRLGAIKNIDFLWWSLSLGACLGGNGTIIAASANLVAAGMAERGGVKISFLQFLKVGFPLMVMSVAIATLYLAAWFTLDRATVLWGTLAFGAALSLILGRFNRGVYTEGRSKTYCDKKSSS